MNKKISFLVTIGLSVLKLSVAQEVRMDLHTFNDSFQNQVIDQVEKERELIYSHLDSVKQKAGGTTDFSAEDVNIAQRINRLQKTIPLEYNDRVKVYLDKYISRNYKPYMEKLLGLGNYYFPIYDQIFAEQGIPDEVKYLSVVESSLNPHTVSTSGAVGPWQFIYGTAKIYNLTMDGGFDERKDVYSTTYAVSSYLKEAHDEFNDWLLALASYNCGRGCVRRAIQRSGLVNPNYWELSPFLPKETQNYIPKFIAMTYVLNHAELYGLVPQQNDLMTDHKVLMVDKAVSLSNVAQGLNCSADLLKQLNPGYKGAVVSGSAAKPRRLIIPYHESMSDSLIYAALNNQRVEVMQALASVESDDEQRHQVKRGETVASIAKEYGVSVQQIRTWNRLSAQSSITGRNLIVSKGVDSKMAKNVIAATKTKTTAKSNPTFVSYTVRKGDTLSDIADKHRGSSVNRIKSDNNIRGSHLKIGQKLKIYKGKG